MIPQLKKMFDQGPDGLPRLTGGGFTVTEVMAVMLIIGILMGVAVPVFLSWLPNMKLKSAARDLYSRMQNARMLAVKENREWAIVFDTANNRYYVCNDQGADGTWTGAADLTGTGDNTIVERFDLTTYQYGIGFGHGNATQNATSGGGPFPANEVSFPNSAVIFNPRGTVSQAGFVYLDHQGNSTTFAIGALTSGSIRLRQWFGTGAEPWN